MCGDGQWRRVDVEGAAHITVGTRLTLRRQLIGVLQIETFGRSHSLLRSKGCVMGCVWIGHNGIEMQYCAPATAKWLCSEYCEPFAHELFAHDGRNARERPRI